MGIDVGDVHVLVCVEPLVNRQYIFGHQGKMTLDKVWSNIRVYYPLQTIVRELNVHNPDFVQYTHVEDVFAPNSTVFMVSTMYYGSKGLVVDPSPVKTCGRIKSNINYISESTVYIYKFISFLVSLTVHPEPDFTIARSIQNSSMSRYDNAYNAASQIGISGGVLSVITGSFFVVFGDKRFPLPDNTPKANIGLQLKFPKKVVKSFLHYF